MMKACPRTYWSGAADIVVVGIPGPKVRLYPHLTMPLENATVSMAHGRCEVRGGSNANSMEGTHLF
jgi:hypothetical protein